MSTRALAEREREDFAVRLIQRRNLYLADLCRDRAAPAFFVNVRPVHALHSHHRHWTNANRRESSSWSKPKQPRAELCSTERESTGFAVSQAWNETGSRFGPSLSLLPVRRTHNDLKSQTMSRSQSRRLRHARPLSYLATSCSRPDCSNVFFCVCDRRSTSRCDFWRRQRHARRCSGF